MTVQIVVFPRGQLTAADKKALREAGVVPVEADDPKAVVTVIPLAAGAGVVTPDAMLMSLLYAVVASGSFAGDRFAAELQRRLLAIEKAGGQ